MSSDLREASGLDSVPEAPAPRPVVGIGVLGWARWAWRQLTSMRTALLLLFLLALASVPGSVFPQRAVDGVKVAGYLRAHPSSGPWLDRLRLFDVFSSPWFSAIYLLLFISLAGCVVPRTAVHLRAIRARPPAPPRNLGRLPVARRWETGAAPEVALAEARAALRADRYRVDAHPGALSGESGHLRETGNLLFHLALILILFAVAFGKLAGWSADVVVTEGRGFSNAVALYDSFRPGAMVSEKSLTPFSVQLDKLSVRYQVGGQQSGAPRDFAAAVRWRPSPDAPFRTTTIAPNHPLAVDGTKVFLLGNGYAPHITVRDASGRAVFSGAVPFPPKAKDPGMTSTGVVKVPDASEKTSSNQIGIKATFLPTAVTSPLLGTVSVFPDAQHPVLRLDGIYRGDLGVDGGIPQNVYRLDTRAMKLLPGADGKALTAELSPGGTFTLPDKLGSVTFDGVGRFAALQVAHDPGRVPAFFAAVLAVLGLLASLFVRRRRVFVRVARGETPARTLVEVGALARADDALLGTHVERIVERIQRAAAPIAAHTSLETSPQDGEQP